MKGIVVQTDTRNKIDYLKIKGYDNKIYEADVPNMKFGYAMGTKVDMNIRNHKVYILSKQDGTCYIAQKLKS